MSVPQDRIEGIWSPSDAIIVTAIRKLGKGSIQGEPIPDADAIDDLGRRQTTVFYKFEKFRSRYVEISGGAFHLHGAGRIREGVLKFMPRH
jgi:hypothetical protein